LYHIRWFKNQIEIGNAFTQKSAQFF